MYFLVDSTRKVVFGWSAKCGCSHIKRIFHYFQNNKLNNPIHIGSEYNQLLPEDIENYTTILFTRNPYKRLVSGFLDKYRTEGEFRYLWKHPKITFSMFVDELLQNDWNMVEKHHFTPQTSEKFDKKIVNSKCLKCFDIENIDYVYLEQLYNMQILKVLVDMKEGHERKMYESSTETPVYDMHMDDYYTSNVDIKYFYSAEIHQKVFNFYIQDFVFFQDLGINYTDYLYPQTDDVHYQLK